MRRYDFGQSKLTYIPRYDSLHNDLDTLYNFYSTVIDKLGLSATLYNNL